MLNNINTINQKYQTKPLVKRAGKDVVTVEIFKDTYSILKERAELERYTVKEYINNILDREVKQIKILLKSMPNLSKISLFENRIMFIMDKKIGDEVEVFIIKGNMHCEYCESNECIHVQFALLQPEALKMYDHGSGPVY